MGDIAGEEDAAMAEAVHQLGAIAVRSDPDDLDLGLAEMPAQPVAHGRGIGDRRGVGIGAHLVVEAPDAVRHRMLPDGAAVVEMCLGPGPALGRQRLLEAHIGDTPAVLAELGGHRRAERAANAAGQTGGVDHPVRLEGVAPLRRLDLERHVIGRSGNAGDAVAPAQISLGQRHQTVDQEPFDVELLQVDEGRLPRQRPLRGVEAVEDIVIGEHLADRPGDTLLGDALINAEAVENLKRLLGIDDAAARGAAHADGIVLVEHDDGDAAAGEIAGRGEAGKPAADDCDFVAETRAVELRRAAIGEGGQGIADVMAASAPTTPSPPRGSPRISPSVRGGPSRSMGG